MIFIKVAAVSAVFFNGLSDLKTRETFTFLSIIPIFLSLFLTSQKVLALIVLVWLLFGGDTKFAGGGDIDAFLVLLVSFGLSESVLMFAIAAMLSVAWEIGRKVGKGERKNKDAKIEKNTDAEEGKVNEKGVPFVAMLSAASMWYLALAI